jgi:hypothetical protein
MRKQYLCVKVYIIYIICYMTGYSLYTMQRARRVCVFVQTFVFIQQRRSKKGIVLLTPLFPQSTCKAVPPQKSRTLNN